MDFISIKFVCFLCITLLLYYLVGAIKNKRGKKVIPQWPVLLIASLIFYGLANIFYLVFILVSAFVTFTCGYCVQNKLYNRRGSKRKLKLYPKYIEDNKIRGKYEKRITALAIIFNVLILAVLKYYNFFAGSINSFFDTDIVTYKFIIPLGISFYTFSLVAYSIDTYRRKFYAENNFFKFILFVTYFPKVLQGPISSYDTLKDGELFTNHAFSNNEYTKHFLRIAIGLMKKVAIANVVGLFVNSIYSNYSEASSWILILGTLLYSIQLYCDFSGFLDMTIGISGLFGIKLEENFNTPYLSSSIQEFWRRWHITLGAWLKNYIYIPLGGNRVSKFRWIINTFIIWLISGIWHGANWTYVVWGLYFGLLLVLGKFCKPLTSKIKNKLHIEENNLVYKMFLVTKTFLLVNLGWVLFRSNSLPDAFSYIGRMVSFNGGTFNLFENVVISYKYLIMACTLIILLIIGKSIYNKNRETNCNNCLVIKNQQVISFIIICVIFVLCIYLNMYMNSIGGGESSFIYFDF